MWVSEKTNPTTSLMQNGLLNTGSARIEQPAPRVDEREKESAMDATLRNIDVEEMEPSTAEPCRPHAGSRFRLPSTSPTPASPCDREHNGRTAALPLKCSAPWRTTS